MTKEDEQLIRKLADHLADIECEDRAFANQCFAGTAVMKIDAVIEEHADEETKGAWEWLKAGLAEMNDNYRVRGVKQ